MGLVRIHQLLWRSQSRHFSVFRFVKDNLKGFNLERFSIGNIAVLSFMSSQKSSLMLGAFFFFVLVESWHPVRGSFCRLVRPSSNNLHQWQTSGLLQAFPTYIDFISVWISVRFGFFCINKMNQLVKDFISSIENFEKGVSILVCDPLRWMHPFSHFGAALKSMICSNLKFFFGKLKNIRHSLISGHFFFVTSWTLNMVCRVRE